MVEIIKMEKKDGNLLKFSYDIFSFTGKKKIIVLNIDENTDGSFTLEIANREHETVDSVKEILNTLVGEIEDISESYTMDGTWLLTFAPPKGALDVYESKHSEEELSAIEKMMTETEKSKAVTEITEKIIDEVEEYDDRKGVDIVEKKGNVTVYADGVVEIDLEDWRFEAMDPEEARVMPPLPFATIMQIDWTRLVGYFLDNDDIKDKEVESSRRISGRWMFKGRSPTDEEYYFDIHDIEGSDIPHIYAHDNYGINELSEWFDSMFKGKKISEYKREFILPNGTKAEFGIDKEGNPWQSWNRCPWLEELGL
jgi:hypothetical protein